jgi:hypothetical protein
MIGAFSRGHAARQLVEEQQLGPQCIRDGDVEQLALAVRDRAGWNRRMRSSRTDAAQRFVHTTLSRSPELPASGLAFGEKMESHVVRAVS